MRLHRHRVKRCGYSAHGANGGNEDEEIVGQLRAADGVAGFGGDQDIKESFRCFPDSMRCQWFAALWPKDH